MWSTVSLSNGTKIPSPRVAAPLKYTTIPQRMMPFLVSLWACLTLKGMMKYPFNTHRSLELRRCSTQTPLFSDCTKSRLLVVSVKKVWKSLPWNIREWTVKGRYRKALSFPFCWPEIIEQNKFEKSVCNKWRTLKRRLAKGKCIIMLPYRHPNLSFWQILRMSYFNL